MAKLRTAKLKLLGLAMAAPFVLAGCRADSGKDATGIHDSPVSAANRIPPDRR